MLAVEAAKAQTGKGSGKGRRRLPLHVLFEAAIKHAREGYTVTRSQAQLTVDKYAELETAPGFLQSVPDRRQGAGGGNAAQAGRLCRDARPARQCRARRFLSRRCRPRDRRRPGAHRQSGDARRPREVRSAHRRAAQRQDRRRHALQHAAADARPGLADDPRFVRPPARVERRKLRAHSRPDRSDQARLPRARPRGHRSGQDRRQSQRLSGCEISRQRSRQDRRQESRARGRRRTRAATRSGWAPPTPAGWSSPISSRSTGSSAPAACCRRPAS